MSQNSIYKINYVFLGGTRAEFTAFPDLKAWTEEKKTITTPGGESVVVYEEKDVVPLPRLPVLPAGASVLRRVRYEQVFTGFGYLQVSMPVLPPRLDFALPAFQFLYYFRITADAYRTAAELEDRPTDRVPWYEARVRLLKLAERTMLRRVLNGSDPPHILDATRFYRFQMESDLLKLKAEVEKAGFTTDPAPVRAQFPIEERWGLFDVKQRFYYTAFPALKPPTIEKIEVKGFEGKPQFEYRDTDVVPLPALPAVGANTPLAQKIRLEQVREGLAYLDYIREVVLNGSWNSAFLPDYLRLATATYRAAAELEGTSAKRIPWYEARVRALKSIEAFIYPRVQNGTDSLDRLYAVRVQRLRAEAELLILKEEAAKPIPVVGPVVVCPPVGVRPRVGLLPRLFHRR